MKLYKHKDYKEYKEAQILKNTGKLNLVWIKKDELIKIVNHAKEKVPEINFGICHGVRNAWEVKQFRKYFKANIIGTEISYTATKFDNTIQWDFHDIKNEWINKFDFIYSNSFDHSNRPEYCLDQWMKCLKATGICYIHWHKENENKIDPADCFAASRKEYRKLFSKKYKILDEFATMSDARVVFAIKHI
jgi:hypothetical protein